MITRVVRRLISQSKVSRQLMEGSRKLPRSITLHALFFPVIWNWPCWTTLCTLDAWPMEASQMIRWLVCSEIYAVNSPKCIRADSLWFESRRIWPRTCMINRSKRPFRKSSTNITLESPIKTSNSPSKKWMRSKILQPDRLRRWSRIMLRLKNYWYPVRIQYCLRKISKRILKLLRKWWRIRTFGCVRASALSYSEV
jgi:hypothetical protein